MCRAAWDPPSVGKPLRPGKLPQVEEDGWGQRCFFTFALSGNSLHPDSKLRVIHAQGILMFCSFLENLSVLDTAEELLFIKKKIQTLLFSFNDNITTISLQNENQWYFEGQQGQRKFTFLDKIKIFFKKISVFEEIAKLNLERQKIF